MKKLYCALAAAAFALSANAADYYLIGGFNNWANADPNAKFTEVTTNEYVLDYEGTLTSGFKINDGTWDNPDVNFGGSTTLKIGEVYNLIVDKDSGNITLSENIENPHLVLNVSNPKAPTLLITGKGVEAEYTYDLWGSFADGKTWSAVSLTEKDGKWVSEKTTVGAACDFGIRKNDAATNVQIEWLASAEASNVVVLDKALSLKVNGTNFKLAEGEYVFTVDPAAMTIVVTGEGGEIVVPPAVAPESLYLVGEFNKWTNPSDKVFTKNGSVYTLEVADGLSGEWKITDGTWDWSFGAGADQDLTSGVEADTWFGGQNFKTSFTSKTTIELTLVEGSYVKGSSIPSKIKVTVDGVGSGIESVEAANGEAVYFNLQGVKVANPEKGVFVKVANGKAVKVAL